MNERKHYGPAGTGKRRALVPQGKGRPLPQVKLGRTAHQRDPKGIYVSELRAGRSVSHLKWIVSTCLAAVVGVVAITVVIYGSMNDQTRETTIAGSIHRWGIEAIERSTEPLARPEQATTLVAEKSDRLQLTERGISTKHIIHMNVRDTRNGREFIKIKPYMRLVSILPTTSQPEAPSIPPFNPLKLYAVTAPIGGGDAEQSRGDAKASQISVKVLELAGRILPNEDGQELADREVAALVTRAGDDGGAIRPSLAEGDDPAAAASSEEPNEAKPQGAARAEPPPNTTVLVKNVFDNESEGDDDRLEGQEIRTVRIGSGESLEKLLRRTGIAGWQARALLEAMSQVAKPSAMQPGYEIHLTLVPSPLEQGLMDPIKMNVFSDGQQHIVSVIRESSGEFVASESPSVTIALPSDRELRRASLYESFYHTALAQGLSSDLIQRLLRIHAYDTDFKRRVGPGDNFEAFFDVIEDGQTDGRPGELLATSITVAGESRKFYRFRTPDGVVDYYDETGSNAKRFLLRKPVRGGTVRFTSGFGMRFHPLLKQRKMHTGVDWAAPSGTPIIASGNGTIEEAQRRGGNGNFIRIRHANGYQTTYSHLSRFARGAAPGAKVRQGQVIGYVGSTGLSSGPHLHFEVHVNRSPVDPMRINVPRERQLKGRLLGEFLKERARIDDLMMLSPVKTRVASADSATQRE